MVDGRVAKSCVAQFILQSCATQIVFIISERSELQGASHLKTRLVVCSGGYCCAIGVQHTEVPNLGASWSRFLAVTLMID